MESMIEISVLDDEDGNELFAYESCCVPREGETFELNGDEYIVSEVTWYANDEDGMYGVNIYLRH